MEPEAHAPERTVVSEIKILREPADADLRFLTQNEKNAVHEPDNDPTSTSESSETEEDPPHVLDQDFL